MAYDPLGSFFRYNSSIALEEASFLSTRIFGGPLYYTSAVDPRISVNTVANEAMGRMTAQTIMHNPTIISICPCKVVPIRPGSGGKSVESLITAALRGGDDVDELLNDSIESFASDKMLFTCKPDYNAFANEVNLLTRVFSIFMGIGDEKVILPRSNGKSYTASKLYKNMDWREYQLGEDVRDTDEAEGYEEDGSHSFINNSGLGGVFSAFLEDMTNSILRHQGYVHFYAQNSSEYSETISNGTRESAIASKVSSMFNDDYLKDFTFLTGLSSAGDATANGLINNLLMNSDLSDSGWGSLLSGAGSYLKGGKFVFPQMIDDSTYSKSIRVAVKLVSPSGDLYSIFTNIMLPLAHMIALALPRQMSANVYTYPHLVRLFSRGWMNCEMGLVTDFNVQRGGQDDNQWTINNLPTEVDVTMEITPLYNSLMLSSASKPIGWFKNDGLQEYLGTMCGVNLKGDNISNKIKIAESMVLNAVPDMANSVIHGLFQKINTTLGSFMTLP